MNLTRAERRGALMVLGLFALGAAHDLWRIHRPSPPWSEVSPPAHRSPVSSSHGGGVDASAADSGRREMHDRLEVVPKRVDLNQADAGELDRLPGIGPVLAGRIVEHRRSAGPFRSPEDLLAVRGIGPALVERLRDRVTAGPPDSAGSPGPMPR